MTREIELKKAYEIVEKKICKYENENNIKLNSKENILEYLKNETPQSLGSLSKELTVLRLIRDVKIELKDVRDVVDYKEIYNCRYLTKEELLYVCNKIENIQDSILLVLAYYNLMGDGYEVALNLKCEDIDLNNGTVAGVKIDDCFMPFFERALEEKTYYRSDGLERKLVISNYLIKPCAIGKQGLMSTDDKTTPSVIKTRLGRMKKELNASFTFVTLKNSKIVYDVLENNLIDDYTLKEVRLYLNNNGIKMNPHEFLNIVDTFIDKK